MFTSNTRLFTYSPDRKTCIAVFISVFVIALCFALYTNHAWEDYYITYRPSKNLATGHGLVFNPGEHVHTFTSPLNVLIPAILSFLTGNTSDGLVLWLYRLVSCLGLGITAVFLLKIVQKQSPPLKMLPSLVLLSLFGIDAKIIDFSINGQETAFLMLFLGLTLYALLVPSRFVSWKLGIAWGGLMWTRPDSFVYIGGIALGFLLFAPRLPVAKSRTDLLRTFCYASVIATILYLPWFLWAWHYYGSPIPHTVIAKGVNMSSFEPGTLCRNFFLFPFYTLARRSSLHLTFLPSYPVFWNWPDIIIVYSQYLAWICAFFWCLPFGRSQARAASFAFMLGHLYLTHYTPIAYPWYIPSCTLLGIFVFSHIVDQSLGFASRLKDTIISEKGFRQLTRFIRVSAEVVIILSLLLTLLSAYQSRIQQRVIEEGHRKQIGLWLRQHAASAKDTVFLEPLGYIGYFSQLKMYDSLGLSSPEVVAARKSLKTDNNDWAQLILKLQPDWLVLRPGEVTFIHWSDQSLFNQHYSEVKVFDVSKQVASYRWLPTRKYLEYDQTFRIFKRIRPQG